MASAKEHVFDRASQGVGLTLVAAMLATPVVFLGGAIYSAAARHDHMEGLTLFGLALGTAGVLYDPIFKDAVGWKYYLHAIFIAGIVLCLACGLYQIIHLDAVQPAVAHLRPLRR